LCASLTLPERRPATPQEGRLGRNTGSGLWGGSVNFFMFAAFHCPSKIEHSPPKVTPIAKIEMS